MNLSKDKPHLERKPPWGAGELMPIRPLTQQEFQDIRRLLLEACGIALNDGQEYLVQTRLAELALEVKVTNFTEFYRLLQAQRSVLLPRVIDLMTTHETLWFRDHSCWNTLEKHLLPKLFSRLSQGESQIRIWSAACSTGQEPYSLAILIDELCRQRFLPTYAKRFSIVATDVSHGALNVARQGRYDTFNIKRGLSEARRQAYFTPHEELWQLREEVCQRVQFQYFNLIDSFQNLGKFHLVLCRNVAIYFPHELKMDLFAKLARQLVPEGSMLLGATESLMGYAPQFQTVEFEQGVYYQLHTPAK